MAINTKISVKTLDLFKNNYNQFKESILKKIHEKYLKDTLTLEELKQEFHPKSPTKESQKKENMFRIISRREKCCRQSSC